MTRRLVDSLLERPTVYGLWQAPFAGAKLRPFLSHTTGRRFERVLDVGCGPGTNTAAFDGTDYVGIDINPDYIETARRRHRGRFIVGDVADERVMPDEQFDCVFANSLMHHLDTDVVTRLLRRMSLLTTPEGEVHILDLVLPPQPSAARLMARLDRGRFARPLDEWRSLFTDRMHERHFETYSFGLPGLPLWQMVYFVGVRQ